MARVNAPPAPARSIWSRLLGGAFAGEDAGALAVFRILWGLLMAVDAYRYIALGRVERYFIEPTFFFKYIGFEWVEPLPDPWMHGVFWLMLGAGVAVALGFAYRLASVAIFVTHTYIILIEATFYLNHTYLMSVLAFVMIFLPANRALSVDARLRRGFARRDNPRWARLTLAGHMAVVYFYGGIAKLNTDWLVYQTPVRQWMKNASERVPYGGAFIDSELVTYVITYTGCVFDLTIAPLLFIRRTRPVAVVLVIAFHATNMYLFRIGVFPWLGIGATVLFLDAGWYRHLPGVGNWLGSRVDGGGEYGAPGPRHRNAVGGALALWAAVHLFLPLRHHFLPGNVAWNEEGHYMSWRMKLRSKIGRVKFVVVYRDSGRKRIINPRSTLGKRHVRKMAGKPELIRQYANYIARRFSEEGIEVDVYADAWCRLNYRKEQRFIDPKQELGHLPASFAPYPWVLPFEWEPPPRDRKAPRPAERQASAR